MTLTQSIEATMLGVYERFHMTPDIAEDLETIERIGRAGPRMETPAESMSWRPYGAENRPWGDEDFEDLASGISWLLKEDPPLTHKTLRRLHAVVAPKISHEYRTADVWVVSVETDEIYYECPPAHTVEPILDATLYLMPRCPVPIGNALLHLNVIASHPFDDGCSRVRMALSTARTIATTHPSVGHHVVETIRTKWDLFFYRYLYAWMSATGPSWTPKMDVTGFIRFWVAAEARMLTVASTVASRS